MSNQTDPAVKRCWNSLDDQALMVTPYRDDDKAVDIIARECGLVEVRLVIDTILASEGLPSHDGWALIRRQAKAARTALDGKET